MSHYFDISQEKKCTKRVCHTFNQSLVPRQDSHGDIAIIDLLFDIVLNSLSNYLFLFIYLGRKLLHFEKLYIV